MTQSHSQAGIFLIFLVCVGARRAVPLHWTKTKKAYHLSIRQFGLINFSSISRILPIKDTLSL